MYHKRPPTKNWQFDLGQLQSERPQIKSPSDFAIGWVCGQGTAKKISTTMSVDMRNGYRLGKSPRPTPVWVRNHS